MSHGESTGVHDLPTKAEMDAERAFKPQPKGLTRLQQSKAEAKVTKIDHKEFLRLVRVRDEYHCRHCGREVKVTLARIKERAEVNHIHGRTGDLLFEVRAAILLCLECHEYFTGRVGSKRLLIIPTQTFTIRQGTFTDARYKVTFKWA